MDFSEIEDIDITDIQPIKRGRKTLLPDELDHQVQAYIETFRNSGGIVTTSICLSVGLGIVNATDKQLLSENGGPLTLTKTWAFSRLKRMNMVKRIGSCTVKTFISDADFEKRKEGYLSKICKAVTDHGIPPELI